MIIVLVWRVSRVAFAAYIVSLSRNQEVLLDAAL